MRFWWVNQNQTFEQEVGGGYLWSPKRRRDGGRNRFYDNMREVSPGDLVLSFRDRRIGAAGVAHSYCYECPKPPEFGQAGPNWDLVGWKVDVSFKRLSRLIRPKDHIELIRPLLPARYSPLQDSGDGIQSVYLAEIDRSLAELLAGLIGEEVRAFLLPVAGDRPARMENVNRRGLEEWEDHIQAELAADSTLRETEKAALVKARRGQGLFKQRVMAVEAACRITKVDNPAHLVGSHIRPWRDSTNDQRLDGENGLLLTPSIDHLFDRGFISFEGDGRLLVSPTADAVSLRKMGIETERAVNVGAFSRGQREYLEFHREEIFLRAG